MVYLYDNRYAITNNGEIISFAYKKPKQLAGRVNSQGYRYAVLSIKGKNISKKYHRLVAESFIENPHKYKEVHHRDGNKLNNNVANLEWITRSKNAIHARNMGVLKCCKINMQTAKEIRAAYNTGNYSKAQLARNYNLKPTTIFSIVNYVTWNE